MMGKMNQIRYYQVCFSMPNTFLRKKILIFCINGVMKLTMLHLFVRNWVGLVPEGPRRMLGERMMQLGAGPENRGAHRRNEPRPSAHSCQPGALRNR